MTSCATMTTITSQKESEVAEGALPYRYYNSKEKIRYHVLHDSENLHLKIGTVDKAATMKIMRGGLTVYFDAEAKKNETVYLQYPVMGSPKMHRSLGGDKPEPPAGGEMPERPQGGMNNMIHIPGNAIFYNGSEQQDFNVNQENSAIKVSIEQVSEEELNYDLVIPFDKIFPQGNVTEFSVGIVSGIVNVPDMGGAGGPPNGAGGPPQGGSGGGMPPGGGSGDRMPMGGGGPPSGGDGMETAPTAVELWVKIALFEKEK